ncbi:hypothetical protein RND81_02G248500 [Saponaria officinalis]|uniref:Protein LAZY 1 n=1 Tax=Saponaria officinalis TaxID=3572 RepID=A0AAW1MYJ7_SAPOF
MKLLSWMHCKLQQGSTETQREFPIGQLLLTDPHFYRKQNHDNGTWRLVNRDGQTQRSFANLETTKLAEFEENASAAFSELFEGFLAIGTLGAETGIIESETPTFSMSFERLAEGETEVTENELRLERGLATEAKDDGWVDSYSQNSHASTITLSGKPMEISESTGHGNLSCPLHEYLLGSTVELPEKAMEPKKENRTSLGDLFEKHKLEEISEIKCKRGEKRGDKEGEKRVMGLTKKILNRKMATAVSKNSSGSTQGTDTTAAETKLFKILHKFDRKVHPECLAASTEKPEKSQQIGFKDIIPCNVVCYKDKYAFPNDISNVTQRARSIGHTELTKSDSRSSQFAVVDSDSNKNRECWITTDANYLVLEL